MRKIIGFRTLCVGLGIWVGTVGVSAQGEFKALPWSQSTAYNSYLMRDVHRQFADRQSAIQQAFASPAGMQEYLEGCRERYKQIVGTFPEKGNLTYIIHSGFISGYQNRYGDNLKPPTNVYHRMTA